MHCAENSLIWLPTDYSTSGMAWEPHQVVTDIDTDKQRELQSVCMILNHLIPSTTLILDFLHGVVKTISLFSFFFSSLKISCICTTCLGPLSLSPSLKIPLVSHHTCIHTTPNLPSNLFIYLFITHWVHLMSPIYTCTWGHPLEQGQPTDGHAPIEKQLSPRFNNYCLISGWSTRRPLHILAGIFHWLDLVQVATSSLSPDEAKPCCDQRLA